MISNFFQNGPWNGLQNITALQGISGLFLLILCAVPVVIVIQQWRLDHKQTLRRQGPISERPQDELDGELNKKEKHRAA